MRTVEAPTPVAGTGTVPRLSTATARRFGRAVVTALPAWLVARAIVLATLALAHRIVDVLRPGDAGAVARVHQGLLAWDAGWYASIARHGYAAAGRQSLRFFPAFPLAARLAARVTGVGAGTMLVVIANLCALAAMAVLVLLVRRETGDDRLARRSAWLVALAPPAYTLVLGYAEGPLLLCTTTAFLALRARRWWWAAAAGLVAGAVRPIGLILVVPAAVELWRARGPSWPGLRSAAGQAAALVAPVAGTAGFLAWVGTAFGNPWLPLEVQEQGGHRGPITAPLSSMWHNALSFLHGRHVGSALHIPWVLLSLVLLVVVFRRLPVSYGAFAAAVLAVSASSSNLDSFERYALSAFPLVIGASMLTARRPVERAVVAAAAAGMVGYALLAFLGIVVP